jgi:transposase InsO family protein
MPWKARSLMSERFEFCHLALEKGINFSALCQHYGISRKTGYKWLSRFQSKGYEGLFDQSRRPHTIPGRLDSAIESMVVHLHYQYPRWGPRKLHALMKQHLLDVQCPSISSVVRILKRYGLSGEGSPAVQYDIVGRFERAFPNDLWQMDLKDSLKLSDGKKWYPVGIIDDHSRHLLRLDLIPDSSELNVLNVWIRAAREYGFPNETLTDHGTQFRCTDERSSRFRAYLWACEVKHTQGRVRHPQTQGKIERVWRTLKHEVLSCNDYSDAVSWQQCFDEWRNIYNNIRPHQSIGDVAPSTRYKPSLRPFREPDLTERIGRADSQYRRVQSDGRLIVSGKRHGIGSGYAGCTVELRSLNNGCWHVYFRNRFIKELLVTSR